MKTNGRAIEVTTKTRQELAKVFDCTERMVWKALTWDSDTPLARKIRVAAIEKGGRVMNWVPECETIHCTADGTMHQTFGNGAVIVAKRSIGEHIAARVCQPASMGGKPVTHRTKGCQAWQRRENRQAWRHRDKKE